MIHTTLTRELLIHTKICDSIDRWAESKIDEYIFAQLNNKNVLNPLEEAADEVDEILKTADGWKEIVLQYSRFGRPIPDVPEKMAYRDIGY